MLNILLMIITIIIIFIIILLHIGVKISLNYEKNNDEIKGCLEIFIFKKIKIYTHKLNQENPNKDKKNSNNIIKKLTPCFDDLKEFLKSLLNSITISKIDNYIIFGLDSYADTAKYTGIIWGLLSITNSFHENISIIVKPTFNGSIFNGYGSNDFEINLLKLILPIFKLLKQKHVRELIRSILNG